MSTSETTQPEGKAKFLFERSFDEGPSAKPDPHLEEAFARGRAEGLETARHESQSQIATATADTLERLVGLEAMRVEFETKMTRQSVDIAVGLIRKMMPKFCERGGLAEIEGLLIEALKHVLDEPRVVFRVPDDKLDGMQARISELTKKAAYAGEIVLIADDRLGSSDCLVEWADGGVERNLDRLWSEVEAILTRAIDTSFKNISPSGEPSSKTA